MFVTKCLLAAIPKVPLTAIPKPISTKAPSTLTSDELTRLFNLRTKTLYVNEAFTLKAIKHTSPSESKVAYITGKKALGKIAVWRKRGQKRLKAAVRATFSQHAPPGYDYIFYIGPSTITSPWLDIVEQCKKSFSHIRRIAYPRSPKGHGENR